MGEPKFEIDRDSQSDTQTEEVVPSAIESPEVAHIPDGDIDKFYDEQQKKDEENERERKKDKGPTYH